MEEEKQITELKEETKLKNQEVRKLAEENQKNITRLRELLNEADEEKKKRDELNSKVKEASDKRKALIDEGKKLDKDLRLAETESAKYKTEGGMPLGRLEQLIERMEWRLQTQSMPVKEENLLSQEIKKLLKERSEQLKSQPLRRRVYELRKRRQELNTEFRALDEAQESAAKESDKHHETMLKDYKKADEVRGKISEHLEAIGEKRKDADDTYSKLQEVRGGAEAEHEYEEYHDRKEKRKKEEEKMDELEEKAKLIYENFKSGKKVTMEDLQILHMAGMKI
ncbi:MAG: hypothetical protein AABX01_02805 [Candidatus Micrarchaeota archaeon]